jgi:hypothetical protein
MSIRLKYCKPTPEAKNVEIGKKKKKRQTIKSKKGFIDTIV